MKLNQEGDENGDDPVTNRKVFWLCVWEEDRAQLLDASLWPDSVSVSEWFFKNLATSGEGRAAAQHHKDTYKKPPQATDREKQVGDTVTSDVAVATDVSVTDDTILAVYDAANSVVNMDCSVIVNDGGN